MTSLSCHHPSSPDTHAHTLMKETQRMNGLSLNAVVFDVNANANRSSTNVCASKKLMDWSSSSLSLPLPTTTTVTPDVTTVLVPQDFGSLSDAVAFANAEFEKHAASVTDPSTINSSPRTTKTIQILVDPRRVPICGVEEPLRVEARKYGHLILDVLTSTTGSASEDMDMASDSDSSNNKRQRKSERASSDASLKGVVSMETREANQPLIHHASGSLTLRNMRLDHFSPVDMWKLAKTKSSNAALLLEHGVLDNITSVTMEHVTVTSFSGRGVLNRCHHPAVNVVEHSCFVAKLWS